MMLDVPVNAITTRSVRTATNKIKCPVFCTCVRIFLIFGFDLLLPDEMPNDLCCLFHLAEQQHRILYDQHPHTGCCVSLMSFKYVHKRNSLKI